MMIEPTVLSLTIEASNVSLPVGMPDSNLFSHFQTKAIALLKDETLGVHHFGMVPDNSAEGNDELLVDGILFRFDANEELLGIDEAAAPHLVKQAFLAVVENKEPDFISVLDEVGPTKKEMTIVFHF
ncbi:hypothetical protein [Flavobacterium limnophilum]|uniref:hypothetical protein n=1 Tax=Flavobacterium limnophilum TaxID=3003262 RepID=UPI002482C7C8|nr:hypothetical protein [Flavobacterium limnophilum]